MNNQTFMLTAKQKQVFELLSRGRSVKEIASDLQLSRRGVEKTMTTVRTKLNALNTPHAVALLVHQGLVDPA